MKIVVLGLWHLGCVTAACAAKFARVVGLDFDQATILGLGEGKPPIFEPGLTDLIQEGRERGALLFEDDPAIACRGAAVLWVTYDTPVDADDRADLSPVLEGIARCLPHLASEALVLISSQVPAGTCKALETRYPGRRFAYAPENLRLGKALEIFLHQDRIILGARSEADASAILPLLQNFSKEIVVVQTESAEMIKHAINSFLALSIAFMNEVSRICEAVGADARQVERGLKSESRIGPKAYLSPGGPFAGGTLARDVIALMDIAREKAEQITLIPAIKASNDQHKRWTIQKLKEEFGCLGGRSIAVLGLTYKPHTDTLRRSLAVELCQILIAEGASVQAYDPAVDPLSEELQGVVFNRNVAEAVSGVDAIVVGTEWPQLLQVDWPTVIQRASQPLVIDPNGFLRMKLGNISGVRFRSVGQPYITR
jgi:UDPglucose 6-dehydrogenase